MKIYVAGPMRGYPQFNFPAFDEAAEYLRSIGHEVFSPADHDRSTYGEDFGKHVDSGLDEDAPEFDLRAALADDTNWIARHADGVAVLDGWEKSSGARAEVALAHALGLDVGHWTIEWWRDGTYPSDLIRPQNLVTAPLVARPLRARVLEEAARLITGDRNKSYGSPTQNFQNTADLWSVQFGHLLKDGERFTASHVAQAMSLLKLARMIAGAKLDNWTDLAGYAGCGAECDEVES